MLGVVHPDGVRDPARVRGRHVEVRVGVRVDIYLVPDITIRLDTMAIYVCDVHCVSIRARNEVLNWHFQSGEGDFSVIVKSSRNLSFEALSNNIDV